jgi:hypothetical protein
MCGSRSATGAGESGLRNREKYDRKIYLTVGFVLVPAHLGLFGGGDEGLKECGSK